MPISRNASGQGAKQRADTPEQTAAMPSIDVRINRLNNDPSSKIRADASITIGGMFAVHGLKVVDGQKGLFVSMPSRAYQTAEGETQYAEYFHAVTSEARAAIGTAVRTAYEQALSQQQDDGFDRSAPQQNM